MYSLERLTPRWKAGLQESNRQTKLSSFQVGGLLTRMTRHLTNRTSVMDEIIEEIPVYTRSQKTCTMDPQLQLVIEPLQPSVSWAPAASPMKPPTPQHNLSTYSSSPIFSITSTVFYYSSCIGRNSLAFDLSRCRIPQDGSINSSSRNLVHVYIWQSP